MAWAAAAGGAAGGVLGGAISAISASAEGAKARSFAADMYRHRYRWAINDMRKAGLNPILAATQGIGGNITGAAIPSMPDFGASMGRGAEAGIKAFKGSSEKRAIDAAAGASSASALASGAAARKFNAEAVIIEADASLAYNEKLFHTSDQGAQWPASSRAGTNPVGYLHMKGSTPAPTGTSTGTRGMIGGQVPSKTNAQRQPFIVPPYTGQP